MSQLMEARIAKTRKSTDMSPGPIGPCCSPAIHDSSSRAPLTDAPAEVQKLLRQQAAIARFGSFALRERDLMKILTEAVRVCAEGLNAPFSKVCRYRAGEDDLF